MNELQRSTVCLLLVTAVGLSACRPSMPPSVKPTPPLVTDCLEVPDRQLAPVPSPPESLTDEWARKAWRWMSDAIGLVAADRKQWQGERNCIRGKAETGAVR